jgi:hypothetical protein
MIVHKKSMDNQAVDALSRQPASADLLAISTVTPKWLETVIEGYQQDDSTRKLLAKLALTGSNDKGYSLVDGVIRYKGCIWLGHHKAAHQAVLLALHSSSLGGHNGITATY